ncbi:MAG: AAA family ATPase [Deltaproteobacteria bacterium]|nr:AAA family ATPase [Deltaproteobacteria bacterium]
MWPKMPAPGNLMYLEYWGFKKPPFDNTPETDCFYMSGPHVEGLTRLIYAARMRKGCALLAGDIGCGKTALSRVFIKKISSEKKCDIALISNPCQESAEFLQDVLYKLQLPDAPDRKVEILRVLNEKLTENVREGKETLLIVDEAQLLTVATLEEIRLLLNLQISGRFLLTIFLLGQPGLMSKVKRLKQLRQRVAVSYFLRPFTLKETARYIFFRQRKAGAAQNVFSKQAIEMIYMHSNGLAGTINNLCDLALLAGFGEKEKIINLPIVKDVIQDGAI